MWLFFDSYEDSGSSSLKIVKETKEELLIAIANYALSTDTGTGYFEIVEFYDGELYPPAQKKDAEF